MYLAECTFWLKVDLLKACQAGRYILSCLLPSVDGLGLLCCSLKLSADPGTNTVVKNDLPINGEKKTTSVILLSENSFTEIVILSQLAKYGKCHRRHVCVKCRKAQYHFKVDNSLILGRLSQNKTAYLKDSLKSCLKCSGTKNGSLQIPLIFQFNYFYNQRWFISQLTKIT